MKGLILVLGILVAGAAQGGETMGYSSLAGDGVTACKVVSRETGHKVPLKVEIEWGESESSPGDLPPYSVHQQVHARVTLDKPRVSQTFDVVFKKSGGTTRCNWYQTTTGEIEGVAGIAFVSVQQHSNCGAVQPSSTIVFAGSGATYDLKCEYVRR